MKIILSRKGFDSANGGVPSPIFPDGALFSLPIPASNSPAKFRDVKSKKYDIAKMVADLSRGKIDANRHIHLDPDIDFTALNNRAKGWRGAFGQLGAAQKHLSNQGVNTGDMFLFFGWFKCVEQVDNIWKYVPNSPNLHIIYGWLFVDEVLPIDNKNEILNKYPWLDKHPHLTGINDPQNTIYVGSKHLPKSINASKNGYGNIAKIDKVHILTKPDQKNRSVWQMPAFFYPSDNKPALSYHTKKAQWKILDKNTVLLNSVGRGQEFVLDANHYPEAINWVGELLK